MDTQSLYQQISNYDQWKRALRGQLARFQEWSRDHGALNPEVTHSLKHAYRLLAQENFTLAFVGEFSRGKTELINALLFKEFGQRLLPSTPGRTTMCPTEIYCETGARAHNNCVRLLPIETRRTSASMQSFKRIPEKWVTIDFDPKNHRDVSDAIGKISASKYVSANEARTLGFDANHYTVIDGKVEIPAWRHALITLDHPLLRHGLHIIDTPGLNALGNEPELTLRTLPSAQAVVFLLAADSGVSTSDMAIWEEHIDALRQRQNLQVLALLNKVDSLWDDLIPDEEINESILTVRKKTSDLLRLPLRDVIALSAKQGLLGKANNDVARLERSNFLPFEKIIASSIVQNRLRIAEQPVIADILTMFENTRTTLNDQLLSCRSELKKMAASHSPNANKNQLYELRNNIRKTHSHHHKLSLSLRSSQRLLERQFQALSAPVSSDLLNSQIYHTRKALAKSWTTVGLSRTIMGFYDTLEHNLTNLERETQQANRVLRSIYQRPEYRHIDASQLDRHLFNIDDYRLRLLQLTQRANRFKHSIDTLLTIKSTLLKRFIHTLVRESRAIYKEINNALNDWIKEALAPLIQHNTYQKQLLEEHMLRLAKINSQNKSVKDQCLALRNNISNHEEALQALDRILKDPRCSMPSPALALASNKVVSLEKVRKAVYG